MLLRYYSVQPNYFIAQFNILFFRIKKGNILIQFSNGCSIIQQCQHFQEFSGYTMATIMQINYNIDPFHTYNT